MSAPLSGNTVTSSSSEVRISARQPFSMVSVSPQRARTMPPPARLDASDAIAFTSGMEPGATVAMVTGAANGLGRAIAARLRDDGFCVAGADIEPFADRGIAAYHLDVADLDAHEAALDQIEQELGPLSVLVNVAGISVPEPVDRLTVAAYRRQLAVMLDGPVWLARGAGLRMAARGSGHIVNVTSVHASNSETGSLAY